MPNEVISLKLESFKKRSGHDAEGIFLGIVAGQPHKWFHVL